MKTEVIKMKNKKLIIISVSLAVLFLMSSCNNQTSIPEWQNVLARNLIENIEDLTTEFLGRNVMLERAEDILFESDQFWPQGYVVARVSSGLMGSHIILSYYVDDEGIRVVSEFIDWESDDVSINWSVEGYVTSVSGLNLIEARELRHIIDSEALVDLETVTIRVYDFDWDNFISGNFESGWSYRIEIIEDQLWEEVVRLMPEVRDFWYEEQTLYVDLFLTEWESVGGIEDGIARTRLQRTFSSFPNVSEIRFLTDGYPGFAFDGYGRQGMVDVFDVKAQRWMFLCELTEGDLFFERFYPTAEGPWQELCE